MIKVFRFIPLLIIGVAILLAVKFNVLHYLNYTSLKQYHTQLVLYVDQYIWRAILLFCLAYIAVTVISFPGATMFSLLAGFLFGSIIGTLLVVISATIGATLLVIAVRLAFGESVAAKIGSKIKFMEKNLKHNVFFYLLSLRLLPIVPFWLINLAAGVLDIKLRDFILTTFIGIIPGAFVYVNIGTSLTTIFANNTNDFKLNSLVSPQILIALTLLAILSVIPVVIKSLKKGGNDA